MEPLDVMATDWIKDYDPLFDLFDEEMRAGSGVAMAGESNTWQQQQQYQQQQSHQHQFQGVACCNGVATAPDYYQQPAALTAGHDYYDLNNYYYYNTSCKPHHTDELSIILGLDWMPASCLNEFNSPTESSSACSSSVPSPATSSTCGSSGMTTSASCNNVKPSTAPTTILTTPIVTPTSTPPPPPQLLQQQQLQQQQPLLVSTQSQHEISIMKKRKKKSLQARGTSLLAQPSSKLINICNSTTLSTNGSNSSFASSTLLSTSSKTPSTTMTATSLTKIEVEFSHKNKGSAQLIATPETKSIPATIVATKSAATTSSKASSKLGNRYPFELARITKLCASIEHAYAAVPLNL